jgi:hypothetical protein
LNKTYVAGRSMADRFHRSPMNTLPDEVFIKVLGLASRDGTHGFERVCQLWEQALKGELFRGHAREIEREYWIGRTFARLRCDVEAAKEKLARWDATRDGSKSPFGLNETWRDKFNVGGFYGFWLEVREAVIWMCPSTDDLHNAYTNMSAVHWNAYEGPLTDLIFLHRHGCNLDGVDNDIPVGHDSSESNPLRSAACQADQVEGAAMIVYAIDCGVDVRTLFTITNNLLDEFLDDCNNRTLDSGPSCDKLAVLLSAGLQCDRSVVLTWKNAGAYKRRSLRDDRCIDVYKQDTAGFAGGCYSRRVIHLLDLFNKPRPVLYDRQFPDLYFDGISYVKAI